MKGGVSKRERESERERAREKDREKERNVIVTEKILGKKKFVFVSHTHSFCGRLTHINE